MMQLRINSILTTHTLHLQGIISIEPCGSTYWLLSSTQIPLTLFFTLWICFSDNVQSQQPSDYQVSVKVRFQTALTDTWLVFHKDRELMFLCLQDVEDLRSNDGARSNKCMFPVMALLAGVLGGVFGIGGGMLISPLLLQVGIAPEVTKFLAWSENTLFLAISQVKILCFFVLL